MNEERRMADQRINEEVDKIRHNAEFEISRIEQQKHELEILTIEAKKVCSLPEAHDRIVVDKRRG